MFMKKILWPLLFCFPYWVNAQQVTTLNVNSGIDDALLFDDQGRLYGAHYEGSAVYRVDPDDWSSTVFSDGFVTPNGMAFDSEGRLYMADNQGNRIYRIASDGSTEIFVNNFFSPSGLIFEQDSDTLIVTSYEGDKIVKIAPDGGEQDFATGSLLDGPVGLCYDDEGQLYVGNFNNRRIMRIEDNGDLTTISQPSGSGWLGFITYAKGYIYGTLFSQHKIYRTDLMGNDTIILGSSAGTIDGDASVARFNQPNGILASPSQDTLYVSDYGTRSLRMITELLPPTTNTEDVTSQIKWQLGPNPVMNQLMVSLELERETQVQLQVLDNQGRKVLAPNGDIRRGQGQHQIPLDVTDLPAGTYHVQLRINQGTPISQLFVKL